MLYLLVPCRVTCASWPSAALLPRCLRRHRQAGVHSGGMQPRQAAQPEPEGAGLHCQGDALLLPRQLHFCSVGSIYPAGESPLFKRHKSGPCCPLPHPRMYCISSCGGCPLYTCINSNIDLRLKEHSLLCIHCFHPVIAN